MTINDYIMPMTKTKRIIFITYDNAELLDLAGPISVFNAASLISPKPIYKCIVASPYGGLVTHNSGVALDTRPLSSIKYRHSDTVLVIGATRSPLDQAIKSEALLVSLKRASLNAERYGSVCSGSFLLGAAGLLDGKRTTSHWVANSRLQRMHPNTFVDTNALYVHDGKLWSSAGVTTGIDMALAMVEADHGSTLKSEVAKQLVVYHHRPGNQSQFSNVLDAQIRVDEHFAGLVAMLTNSFDRQVKVDEMAQFVSMSERSFYRKFSSLFDISPAKFFERLRLDHARLLLESGGTVKSTVPQTGFKSDSAFRSAFKETYGVTPRHYLEMYNTTERN
jgi:transcriptional regulator GlxA family with amidase domain